MTAPKIIPTVLESTSLNPKQFRHINPAAVSILAVRQENKIYSKLFLYLKIILLILFTIRSPWFCKARKTHINSIRDAQEPRDTYEPLLLYVILFICLQRAPWWSIIIHRIYYITFIAIKQYLPFKSIQRAFQKRYDIFTQQRSKLSDIPENHAKAGMADAKRRLHRRS